jgi:hypothetical protein
LEVQVPKGVKPPAIGAYGVERLSPKLAVIAYPVVAAAYPALGFERWRRYARTAAASPPERSGLLGLRTDSGYYCGLLIYRNDREPWHEPRLSVELFIALDIIDARIAIDALIAATEAKAVALACPTVQVRIERASELISRVRQAGYRPVGEIMTKEIPATTKINLTGLSRHLGQSP